jgi:hypothetical protein
MGSDEVNAEALSRGDKREREDGVRCSRREFSLPSCLCLSAPLRSYFFCIQGRGLGEGRRAELEIGDWRLKIGDLRLEI